ncbi:phosphatidylglycerophosphate synthase, putative [Plasmodium malariae]|uniref:CDP-diacylglycerol--glycerol-3-phosphate 3-phosphatidyltransferase n=1 Tax=Plasmodium malariae TaxID=5858 RepID=A0A1C3KLR0_PLAMA|nr:phosphatidylglycerophosphate synthase, putative [Plasmodium malariae]
MSLKFLINEPKVKLLFSPNEFFNTLNDMFKNSKNRIVISCLYMGIGELEKELIESIKNNKNVKNIKVDILLDKQRGTRPEGKFKESSISVLSDLFNYVNNINISLFHNPLLGAILYNILPYRANEAMGVMHMKAYIGDDVIILSGANLSDSYLRNRQDRYLIIENKLLADSVHKIINTVQNMSFTLNVDLTMQWESDLVNPLVEAHLFREQYYRRMRFILSEIEKDIYYYNMQQLTGKLYNSNINDCTNINCNYRNSNGNYWAKAKSFANPVKDTIDYANNTIDCSNQRSILNHFNNKEKKGKIKSGKINSLFRKLIKGSLRNNVKKNDCEKAKDISTFLRDKDDFFHPLFEKGKSILSIELAVQCGFSIPPIFDESNMLENLLKNIKKHNQGLVISSGYLNFPKIFLKLLRNIYDNLISKKGKIHFITSAPCANSFFKSKGISYYVPLAYSIIAHTCIEFITKNIVNVFKNVNNENNYLEKKLYSSTNIYLEYNKPSWTYHTKGMWLINYAHNQENNTNYEYSENWNFSKIMTNCSNNLENRMNKSEHFQNEENLFAHILEKEELDNAYTTSDCVGQTSSHLPWGTVIGSSNYGYRATYRDLEMSFIIKTNDDNLKYQFQKELNIIYEFSKFVHMHELKLRYPRWLRYLVNYVLKWLL